MNKNVKMLEAVRERERERERESNNLRACNGEQELFTIHHSLFITINRVPLQGKTQTKIIHYSIFTIHYSLRPTGRAWASP